MSLEYCDNPTKEKGTIAISTPGQGQVGVLVRGDVTIEQLGTELYDVICIKGKFESKRRNETFVALYAKVVSGSAPEFPPTGAVALFTFGADDFEFPSVPMPDNYNTAATYRAVVWGYFVNGPGSSSSSSSASFGVVKTSHDFQPASPGTLTECQVSSSSSNSIPKYHSCHSHSEDENLLRQAVIELTIENQKLKTLICKKRP